MLLTFALIALLLVTIAGTFGVLADSAVRAINAYPGLRRAAQASHVLIPEARQLEEIAIASLPAIRSAGPARTNRSGKALRPIRARVIVAA